MSQRRVTARGRVRQICAFCGALLLYAAITFLQLAIAWRLGRMWDSVAGEGPEFALWDWSWLPQLAWMTPVVSGAMASLQMFGARSAPKGLPREALRPVSWWRPAILMALLASIATVDFVLILRFVGLMSEHGFIIQRKILWRPGSWSVEGAWVTALAIYFLCYLLSPFFVARRMASRPRITPMVRASAAPCLAVTPEEPRDEAGQK